MTNNSNVSYTLKVQLDENFVLMLSPNSEAGVALTEKRKAAVRAALGALTRFAQENNCALDALTATENTEAWEVPSWLRAQTFQVEHNPNCPSPFLVRMIGKGRGRIYADERDALGYGQTLAEAAGHAAKTARVIKRKAAAE